MAQAIGYAPVKKNPRIRVKLNTPSGVTITSALYDNPNIMYSPERDRDNNITGFIANWPLSDPTEVCWDVPVNWRLQGSITTLDPKTPVAAATTRQARFVCNKIHVYQDGDGLRLLLLTDIKELEEPRPMTKVKGPAGKAPLKTKAAEAAEKRAVRAEVIAAQNIAPAGDDTPGASPGVSPGVSRGEPDDLSFADA